MKNCMNVVEKSLMFDARHALHDMPELCGCEENTRAYIKRFLAEHTSLEVIDMGKWLYAAHREEARQTVAFRADFDAVPLPEGGAAHRCGHDGHTAALLGLALLIEGRVLGKNVILLFQYGEETGEGGAECCKLFEMEKIDVIYGCHNIPGEPMGMVLLRKGTFACASCGFEAELIGEPTHAAYPENGINPTEAIARLSSLLPKIASELEKKYEAMTMATIVGMYSGEKAFGVAASKGAVYATLRSESGESLDEMIEYARNETKALAERYGLLYKTELYDKFPATVNSADLVAITATKLEMISDCKLKYLDVPFRWSEDFGHYGKHTNAVFFGIGSGEQTVPLHTSGYECPDELALITAEVFFGLCIND